MALCSLTSLASDLLFAIYCLVDVVARVKAGIGRGHKSSAYLGINGESLHTLPIMGSRSEKVMVTARHVMFAPGGPLGPDFNESRVRPKPWVGPDNRSG